MFSAYAENAQIALAQIALDLLIIRREQDRRAMVQMDDADGADSEDAAGAPSMG